ncbi:biopolymer transporter ExbD [Myxococcus sp. K15C18031901]|uniref:ExbD/TolR family protein n=1 Tax=Myxococcus dinghuensis TaxID=2906761 RepID=UPI0020A77DC0|nr:biopolymer transporter ExbD [Myxococcus dinghuensis]MCP3101031.1 biopolymer transporter ExbD [Myxococcus dinghuensis]
MGMSAGGRGGVKSDINVTPLVDVVLVLLIIFMVVTPKLMRGEAVELPKATQVEEGDKSDPVVLSVTPERVFYVEKDRYPDTVSFQRRLTEEHLENPERRFLLKGDQSLSTRDVLQVMKLAKAAGVKHVALAVVKPQGAATPAP